MGVIDRKEREKVEMKRQILDAAQKLFLEQELLPKLQNHDLQSYLDKRLFYRYQKDRFFRFTNKRAPQLKKYKEIRS